MRSHPTRPVRRVVRSALLSGAVLAVLAASGCARAQPGVVAYVGDREISQQRLDDAVVGATEALGNQPVSTQAIATVLIHGELSDQLAAKHQIALSDAARDTLIKGSNLAPLLNVPKALPLAYDVADEQLVAKQLGEAYLTEIAQIPVKLNPRFGVLDSADQTVVTDQTGSLAKPLPTPEPAPTQ